MFKSISTTILTGFITLLPVVLSIYLLYWLAVSSENVMGTALQWVLPQASYFPGLGMIAGLVVVYIVGLLMKAILVRQLQSRQENSWIEGRGYPCYQPILRLLSSPYDVRC